MDKIQDKIVINNLSIQAIYTNMLEIFAGNAPPFHLIKN